MATRRRLDVEMVRRGFVETRAKAAAAIEEGHVLVSGTVAEKPSRLVALGDPIEVVIPERFVSRGGLKLDAALDRFGVDVTGQRCLDAGASTGGFTDCLLQRGAAHVVAVDVGRGQLMARLRADPRVTVLEGVNVRTLTTAEVGESPSIVTADLSFISLTTVAPALAALASEGASFVFLVKPQFEAGRGNVGKGGIVRDAAIHRDVLIRVVRHLGTRGLASVNVMPSPVRGAQGNIEFLLHLVRGDTPSVDEREVMAVVDEAHRSEP